MDEKKLLMSFKNSLGNSYTITIDDPKDDLEEFEILQAMQLIKDKNIFIPAGYEILSLVGAKIVTSNTIEYDLEV